jgi:hypothetical protein
MRWTVKRAAHFVALVVVAFAAMSLREATAQSCNWQQSTDTQTRLWVRDKNQGLPYQATFVVVEPNRKSVALTAHSGSGVVTSVTFPRDFGVFPPLPSGKYHWTATVSGKIAASDDFNR